MIRAISGFGQALDRRLLRPLAGLRGERGNTLIEVAVLAPVLLLVLFGLIDFGDGVYHATALDSSARAGAQYALQDASNDAAITEAVLNSTRLDPATLTVATSRACLCTDNSAIDCTENCDDGKPLKMLVTVTVTQPYETMIPYPGFQEPVSLTGDAVMRVR